MIISDQENNGLSSNMSTYITICSSVGCVIHVTSNEVNIRIKRLKGKRIYSYIQEFGWGLYLNMLVDKIYFQY